MWNQNMMPMQNMQNVNMYSNEMKIEELIKPFQDKIKKLEDEIREKDLEIAQLKVKLYQNKKSNNNQQIMSNNMKQMNMMNSNMNNMNQINQMNMMENNINQINNNMNQMNMMNNNMNQMNMMNNNMNQINNPLNQMNNIGNRMGMYNMNNNMNMMNIQMNQMNNPMFQMCNQVNLMENKMSNMQIMKPKIIKFLSLTVKMEDGHQIMLQSNSDEKMKQVVTKFCCKACYQIDDYDFNIIKVRKAKLDSTVEENEFNAKEDYILAKKKTKNNNENKNFQSNEKSNDKVENIKLLGKMINICFVASSGFKLLVPIGLKNKFKDAANIFCRRANISPSEIGNNLVFLYRVTKINVENIIEQIGFEGSHIIITVLDQGNIIGA